MSILAVNAPRDAPRYLTAPEGAHQIVLGVITVLFCIWILYALFDWVRTRSPVLPLMAVGGLLTAILKPFWGVLGMLNYREGNLMTFVMFNFRGVPLWSTLSYSLFAGGGAYLFYKLVRAGATPQQFWTGALVIFGSNLLIEIPLTGLHLYDYYGAQPLQFYEGGFPLWWLFTNLGGVFSGALIAKAEARFGPRALWLAVPVTPSAFGAWEVWTGWPTFAALNLGGDLAATSLGALATIILSLGSMAAIADIALPHRRRTAPTAVAADPSREGKPV